MTSSRPIPGGRPAGASDREFASPRSAAFMATSPIAEEVIARDLAECLDAGGDGDVPPGHRGGGGDPELTESDADGDNPTLYRRPAGIAYGTTRPALGPTPSLLDEPTLTPLERKRSRNAERSLLRDNHFLPPKHAIIPGGGHDGAPAGFFTQLRRKLFSTKVAPKLRGGGDEEAPLLAGANGNGAPDGHRPDQGHLHDTWEAAVAAGQIRTTWQREAKTLATYARSLVVTFLLQYSISITSIFVVGRIGKVELGAISLGTMTANITCYAPIQGLSTSLDTLCAQAYGSGHKHLVGLQLQRMTWFLLVLLLPIAVLWLNATELLSLVLPERASAELAGLYLRVCIFSMPAYAVFEASKRFVQAQGIFHATTYCLMVAAPLNVFLSWLFVWKLDWGFVGAPISVVITQNLMPVLLFLYVIFVDGYQCWGGFTKRALSNWGPMIRLALPGMIMVEAEWFAFEILTLISGRFGTSQLAAQSILVTITSTTYQVPFPLSVAASTRVANLIGARLVDAAKTSARVAVVAGSIIGVVNMIVVTALRKKLPLLFTDDEEVIAIVANVLPICAMMQVFDGMAALSHGLLRGIGRQEFGGYANLVSYYVIALPVSFGLGLGLGWELTGLWIGVTGGLGLVAVVEYLFLYKYDWSRAVQEAERRNANN
ncbi:hypothetical protein RB597_006783 [Gaeumannomyces tritici]